MNDVVRSWVKQHAWQTIFLIKTVCRWPDRNGVTEVTKHPKTEDARDAFFLKGAPIVEIWYGFHTIVHTVLCVLSKMFTRTYSTYWVPTYISVVSTCRYISTAKKNALNAVSLLSIYDGKQAANEASTGEAAWSMVRTALLWGKYS